MSQSHPRALMPDYLRLIALFGIAIVNVQVMAYPAMEGFPAASIQSGFDRLVVWLVDGLAYFKTYGLFSFMFGVGLAFQMGSAERRGLAFGPLYRNRMAGLILLGLLHALLFFPYDILVLYGITGSILYFLRNWSVRGLIRLGAMLLVIQAVVSSALFLSPEANTLGHPLERAINTGGTLSHVVSLRSETFLGLLPFLLIIQGIAALGWFCLGLAAVKSGLIDHVDHPAWRRARGWFLIPGVTLSLFGAGLNQFEFHVPSTIVSSFAAPIATIGYLGVIAQIAKPPSPRMAQWLTAGGSSLSIYFGQSIVLTTIFGPYGLDLWDGVGPAAAVGIAIVVTGALMGAIMLWRKFFALGPFEWVLRRITQFGQPAKPS
ncbi:MAG: DUF418 domain-containing protein [Pseudomonadota bacterium]